MTALSGGRSRRRAGGRAAPCTTLLTHSIQIDDVGGAKAAYIRASGMTPARTTVSALARPARVTEIIPGRRPLLSSRAAADFGGGFSGEDAAVRQGRARLKVLAAASEQAEAGVSALR